MSLPEYRTDRPAARCASCIHPSHAGVCPVDTCTCGAHAHSRTARLESALAEALALAEQGWAQADLHTRARWDYSGRLSQLRQLVK